MLKCIQLCIDDISGLARGTSCRQVEYCNIDDHERRARAQAELLSEVQFASYHINGMSCCVCCVMGMYM